MAISNRKLGYAKGGVNLICLYTDVKDVGGSTTAFPVQIDGKTLYAKIGDMSHAQASKLSLYRGSPKCLLRKASTIWTVKDMHNFVDVEGISHKIGDSYLTLKARYKDYDGNWMGASAQSCVLSLDCDIPANAKNAKIKMHYNCGVAGFQFYINVLRNGWKGSRQTLLSLESNEIVKNTIEGGRFNDTWNNTSDDHVILPSKYNNGDVSMLLSPGWLGLEFRIDGCDLTAEAGYFSIGTIELEFEEN